MLKTAYLVLFKGASFIYSLIYSFSLMRKTKPLGVWHRLQAQRQGLGHSSDRGEDRCGLLVLELPVQRGL